MPPDLNPAQREAVATLSGPLLVLAGAGTGKTRVVTYRIAELIRHGVRPDRILAVTFTNKAADEMRQRAVQLIGKRLPQRPEISTFHSLGARILRMDGESIGIPRNFTIYDAEDQKGMVKEAMKELNLDPVSLRPGAVLERILGMKNKGVSPEEASTSPRIFEREAASVYSRYVEHLKTNQALDFDDLLLETRRLFEEKADVLERYRDRFRFILIDEYQDTNPVQRDIALLLASEHENLMVVGDESHGVGYR